MIELSVLPRHGNSRRTYYDYEKLFDGRIWRLDRGVDFNATTKSVRSSICEQARNRGLIVETRVDGDSIVVQKVGVF